MTVTSASADERQVKRRAACDECRSKKLKCSGDQPTCSRCMRETITCIYSPQKQMGRPKKRHRTDNQGDEEPATNDRSYEQDSDFTTAIQHRQDLTTGLSSTMTHSVGTMPDTDLGTFDTVFAPDGHLQSWMLPANMGWNAPDLHGQAFDGSISGLTGDNSSENSPATLDLHHGLQNASQAVDPLDHSSLDQATNDIGAARQLPTCACLSTLYLTLSTLTTMDQAFSFPTALHPLREAMSVASRVISCPDCPANFITGLQNVSLLNALLMSLAERFSRILTSISAEADALELHNATSSPSEQQSKTFRLADLSTPGHLHTGGLNCAAAFSLSFSPVEWRSMAKKVVRAEVHGPLDGNDCCPYLIGLITSMEKRQEHWHLERLPDDCLRGQLSNPVPRTASTGSNAERHATGSAGEHSHEQSEHLCLKMLAGTRRMVDAFDWE